MARSIIVPRDTRSATSRCTCSSVATQPEPRRIRAASSSPKPAARVHADRGLRGAARRCLSHQRGHRDPWSPRRPLAHVKLQRESARAFHIASCAVSLAQRAAITRSTSRSARGCRVTISSVRAERRRRDARNRRPGADRRPPARRHAHAHRPRAAARPQPPAAQDASSTAPRTRSSTAR